MFDLAGAPVAPPGQSKHGTGYALDIEGDNNAIKSLCKGLGATLAFDEKSHVHVEFKNGLSP
jgi:LAS superfamily LD-carboxypeptidase LdcB